MFSYGAASTCTCTTKQKHFILVLRCTKWASAVAAAAHHIFHPVLSSPALSGTCCNTFTASICATPRPLAADRGVEMGVDQAYGFWLLSSIRAGKGTYQLESDQETFFAAYSPTTRPFLRLASSSSRFLQKRTLACLCTIQQDYLCDYLFFVSLYFGVTYLYHTPQPWHRRPGSFWVATLNIIEEQTNLLLLRYYLPSRGSCANVFFMLTPLSYKSVPTTRPSASTPVSCK